MIRDIHMKAIEQYFHEVLFIMLNKKILDTFTSVDETLVCDHSNKANFRLVLFTALWKKVHLFNLP